MAPLDSLGRPLKALRISVTDRCNFRCTYCMPSEVFGPVISIIKSRDLCESIDISNDSTMGLQAGVFTNDLNKALYAARRLEVGGVMINEVPTFRVDHMPYGGIKGSGIGREGLKYAIREMTELKMVAIREMDWQTGGTPTDACLREPLGP